jgi:hypothetical protein
MMQFFTRGLKRISTGLIPLLLMLIPVRAFTWTAAHLFNVEVDVEVARSGSSVVTTKARFVV